MLHTEAVYKYQINDTTRLIADYDTTQYDYKDFAGDDIGMFILSQPTLTHYSFGSDDDHTHALKRFADSFNYYSHDNYEKLRARAIGMYFNLLGLNYEIVTLQGYSQGEWAKVVIYTLDPEGNDYLSHAIDSIRQWFNGDIYQVSKQSLQTYVNTQDPEDVIQKWQTDDTIWGISLNKEEDLITYLDDFDF